MPWKYLRISRRRTCDTLLLRRKRTEDGQRLGNEPLRFLYPKKSVRRRISPADMFLLFGAQVLNLPVFSEISQNIADERDG